MNKNAIYTCITGNYDKLIEPKVVMPNFDYICFTDSTSIRSNVWQIKPLPKYVNNPQYSNIKKQRCIKILSYKFLPEYTYTIWVDANITILGNLNELIVNDCIGYDICMPTHPERDCIYDEYLACIQCKKDTKENMIPQIGRYNELGYPVHNGLVQSGIIIRNNKSESVKGLCRNWWDEVSTYSHRDQLSFNYCLYNHPEVKFKYLDKDLFYSKYFLIGSRHGQNNDEKNPIDVIKDYLINIGKSKNINLNFSNPLTIQDKINAIKLNYIQDNEYFLGADIVKLREISKSKLGIDICLPIIGAYNTPHEINWKSLPDMFVVKCNAGEDESIVVHSKSKMDMKKVTSQLNKWMTQNTYLTDTLQLQYRMVDKKIIIERLVVDKSQPGKFNKYSFWCFDGKPYYISCGDDSKFYDIKYKELDVKIEGISNDLSTSLPKNVEVMKNYASKLSEGLKFVVIDFYEIKGSVYLKSFRHTPYGGFFKFVNQEDNIKFGNLIK